ncbi:serine hydrolase domain-containing protein [Leptospira sarikeiensis]|uniref:Class C beta-lactamase-related serine hydrolase n=1 Tax=Leptospira sarikeiensis TaxID=2484943 RepID=A0A4R9KBT2_9LEPT|nr:serine hydrolase [Leptospira sarikeiensis]TGL63325.1 class C beta-lactamase-related serine hydrolase [Leptospira sarikeiensis]
MSWELLRFVIRYVVLICLMSCFFECKKEEDDTAGQIATIQAAIACKTLNECFDSTASLSKSGASFQVFKKDGTRVYFREKGELGADKVGPVFSASKLVTSSTIMAFISGTCGSSANSISLSTTTGDILGWTGVKGSITLRQLLSFTSGLNPENRNSEMSSCLFTLPVGASAGDKNSCVNFIRDNTQTSDLPGEVFYYNSYHMAVAQRMIEIDSGKNWQDLFEDCIASPLSINIDAGTGNGIWYGDISNKSGDGSLAGAYGLYLTANDYAKIMHMLANEGNSGAIISSQNVDEIFKDQYEAGTRIKYSQFALFGYYWHYGLGNWRFCSHPEDASKCDLDVNNHSFGANGFYPWIDRNKEYYAVFGVNEFNSNPFNIISILQPNSASLFFGQDAKRYIPALLE